MAAAAETRRKPPALRLAKIFDRLRWNTKRGCCGRRRPRDDASATAAASSSSSSTSTEKGCHYTSSKEARMETSSRPRRHTCEVLPPPEPTSASVHEVSDAEDNGPAHPDDERPKTNEYQLRVYRCLQCLHLPDWYVEYSRRNAKGFLLQRGDQRTSRFHWPGLARHHASGGGKPPVRSVSDTGAMEMKKISKLSAATVIFRYRPPYLGWRSQERLLTVPRTPAERLASGFKSRKEHSVFNRCYKCKTCNRLNHKGRHIFY